MEINAKNRMDIEYKMKVFTQIESDFQNGNLLR